MNSGELDRELLVYKRTPSRGAAGAPRDTWAYEFTLWAKRLPTPKGEETVLSKSERVQMRESFKVWWCQALMEEGFDSKNYKIKYENRFWDLTSVLEDPRSPRRQALLLECLFTQGSVTIEE